jgi:hypothetical protein
VERDDRGVLVAGVAPDEASELSKQLEQWLDRGVDSAAQELASELAACAPGAGRLVLLPSERRLGFTDARGVTTDVQVVPDADRSTPTQK